MVSVSINYMEGGNKMKITLIGNEYKDGRKLKEEITLENIKMMGDTNKIEIEIGERVIEVDAEELYNATSILQ